MGVPSGEVPRRVFLSCVAEGVAGECRCGGGACSRMLQRFRFTISKRYLKTHIWGWHIFCLIFVTPQNLRFLFDFLSAGTAQSRPS